MQDNAVLVGSWNSAPDRFDAMLSWLDDDPARWFALDGDIVFAAQNIEPISLSSAALSGADDTVAASEDTSDRTTVLVVGVGLAVLAVAGVGALVLALRARRSTTEPSRHSDST